MQTSIRVTDNLVARWSLVNFIRNSHYVGDGVLLNWTKDYEATPQDGPENKISCQQEYNSFTLQSNRQLVDFLNVKFLLVYCLGFTPIQKHTTHSVIKMQYEFRLILVCRHKIV